jgi:hypothetical protein
MAAGQRKLPDPYHSRHWVTAQHSEQTKVSAVLVGQLELSHHAPPGGRLPPRPGCLLQVSRPANMRTSRSCWSLPQPGERRHQGGTSCSRRPLSSVSGPDEPPPGGTHYTEPRACRAAKGRAFPATVRTLTVSKRQPSSPENGPLCCRSLGVCLVMLVNFWGYIGGTLL